MMPSYPHIQQRLNDDVAYDLLNTTLRTAEKFVQQETDFQSFRKQYKKFLINQNLGYFLLRFNIVNSAKQKLTTYIFPLEQEVQPSNDMYELKTRIEEFIQSIQKLDQLFEHLEKYILKLEQYISGKVDGNAILSLDDALTDEASPLLHELSENRIYDVFKTDINCYNPEEKSRTGYSGLLDDADLKPGAQQMLIEMKRMSL